MPHFNPPRPDPLWIEITSDDIAALSFAADHPQTAAFIQNLAEKGLNGIAAAVVRELKQD